VKKRIYYFLFSLLFFTSVQAQTLQLLDRAGLKLQLENNGNISGVELNGAALPYGSIGGFYSRDPKTTTKVPLLGTASALTDGKIQLNLTNSLNDSVTAVLTEGAGYIEVTGELKDLTGTDRGLWLGFNLPVNTTGFQWGQSLTLHPVISAAAPAYTVGNNLVPIPVVWQATGGVALAIPPTSPCVFEVGADAAGLRIQMAFGLSKETTKFPSKAKFCFRIYSIDGTWGFRDALAKFYDWYPDYYRIDTKTMTALGKYHDWIGMNYVGDTYRTLHQIDPTFTEYQAYTKTAARLQNLKNADTIKTNQGFLQAIDNATTIMHYEQSGAKNSPLLILGKTALKNSICYNPNGSFGIYSQEATAIDFPHNCDPALFEDKNTETFGQMYLRKNQDLAKATNSGTTDKFVSIHWDRLGGWSNFLNYRRDHFPYSNYPLTFDQNGTPCIQTQFSNYALFDAFRLLQKQGGLFHEAAGMKEYSWSKMPYKPAGQITSGMFFLASVVAGGWQEGSLNPIELGGLDFERMLIGRKSYRISSGNIISDKTVPTVAMVKSALAKTTAYGFACPFQWQYFYPKGHQFYDSIYSLYTVPEQKAIWDQYEAPSIAIRLAGWEPVTYATTTSNLVQLQRFGRGDTVYLTVWGPNPPPTVEIEVDSAGLSLKDNPAFSEMVSNTQISVTKSTKGWKLSFSMEKDMTRIIKIERNGSQTGIIGNTLNKANAIEIYPKLVKTVLHWTNNDKIDRIKIYTVSGMLVNQSYNTQAASIDLSQLKQGLYMCQFYNKNQVIHTEKFIKQ